MTIKIERDAILCVINNNNDITSSSSSSSMTSKTTSLSKSKEVFDLIHSFDYSKPELDETDDESTFSSSSCSSSTLGGKCVSFADPIVTEVRYRPRTLRRCVRSLFYSVEQTQRFRQEYREERRLKALEEADSNLSSQLSTSSYGGKESGDTPTWKRFPNKNLSPDNNQNTTQSSSTKSSSSSGSNSSGPSTQPKNHRISRVVVLHENTCETFIDGEMNQVSPDVVEDSSKSHHRTSKSVITTIPQCRFASNDFFDNDSFWSGQITWY